MKQEFVIPREGVKVREENGKGHIPAGGKNMALTSYVQRRIKDGDLLIGTAPKSAPVVNAKTQKKG